MTSETGFSGALESQTEGYLDELRLCSTYLRRIKEKDSRFSAGMNPTTLL